MSAALQSLLYSSKSLRNLRIDEEAQKDCPKLPLPNFNEDTEVADLCLGWFWGPDYYFSNLEGVKEVIVGYAGGSDSGPTYKNIKDFT